jgi:integrase
VLTVGRLIDDINEWGWAEAPGRKLVFARDVPRLPRALPHLPPDADRRLSAALHASPNRLRADALLLLLLLRATGMRIGELLDLELDCIHEVPGAGAWLKVPLGKLDTERMVPIDDDTLDLVDRIARRASRWRTRAPASRSSSCSPTRDGASRWTPCAPNSSAPPPKQDSNPLRHSNLDTPTPPPSFNSGCRCTR